MASAFQTLLRATLEHLEDLRAGGAQSVTVDPDLLRDLAPAAARTEPRSRSASAPARPAHPPAAPRSVLVPGPAPASMRPVLAPPTPPRTPPSPAFSPLAPPPVTSVVPAPPASLIAGEPPADPEGAMEAIRQRALACVLCPHLARSRTQVVFGVGSIRAELMFVGEAPGAEEDRQGEPFVGPAGQLLTRIIGAMGFSRGTVYIANILKCRPDLPPGAWGNRAPRPEEMETCKPYLLSQVEIIRPKVIVALGLTAVHGLLGIRGTMGAVRGRWHTFRGIPVMPTFHPSYLLRAEDSPDKGYSETRKTWEDMLQVLTRLEKPVTEKMRGYFLRPAAGG